MPIIPGMPSMPGMPSATDLLGGTSTSSATSSSTGGDMGGATGMFNIMQGGDNTIGMIALLIGAIVLFGSN